MQIGDLLHLKNGDYTTIINIENFPKYQKVYNFEVLDNENYYVTEDGILVHNGYSGTPANRAEQELVDLPQFNGMTKTDIEAELLSKGYTKTPARSGGDVWTKDLGDGTTAAVRVDPPKVRPNPRGYADEVPHIHKETVPTSDVSNGNYSPSSATTHDDFGNITTDRDDTHIPIN